MDYTMTNQWQKRILSRQLTVQETNPAQAATLPLVMATSVNSKPFSYAKAKQKGRCDKDGGTQGDRPISY